MELAGDYTTAGAAMEGPTPSEQVTARTMGGFDFSSSLRNKVLLRAGQKPPKALKTGTTICGVVFDGGVVLGADTRATEGTVVADKNCEKIHYLAPNIHCCGAGTAADTENITQLTASNLELLRRQMGTQSRVVTAMTLLKRRLFQYQGHISAALVLGGVDCTGPHLYTVYPHGSTDKLPFVSMGSGSLAAMAMLESGYKDGLTEDEAKALVARAIRAGIFNDLGSGSNVDLTIIRTDGATEQLRSYESQNGVDAVRAKALRPKSRKVPLGATEVLKETFKRFIDVSDLAVPGSAAGGQAAS